MQELSERSFNQFDTMIVGEAAGIDFARACEITQEGAGLLDLLFHFEHVGARAVCAYNQKSTNLRRWKRTLFRWQELPEALGALCIMKITTNQGAFRGLPLRVRTARQPRRASRFPCCFKRGRPLSTRGRRLA